MKTSRFVSMVMVLAIATLVGCGKKDKKSSSAAACGSFVNGVIVNCFNSTTGVGGTTVDTASTLTSLQNTFNTKSLAEGFYTPTGILSFVERSVSLNTTKFLGIKFESYSQGQLCDFIGYTANTATGDLLIQTVLNDSNCNPNDNTPTAAANYVRSSNTELANALNADLSLQKVTIVTRVVYLNGYGAVQGYGIQVYPSLLSNTYKEYVVSPSLPVIMNPVLIFDNATGATSALYGVQVQ